MPDRTCLWKDCTRKQRCRGFCGLHYDRLRAASDYRVAPYTVSVAEVFVGRKSVDSNGCWNWTGPLSPEGYGRLGIRYTHRLSYELYVEPIPEGLHIDHLCRNKACFNPAHLEPVTRKVNVQRGFWVGGRCRSGRHDVSVVGTVPRGQYKTCAACDREGVERRKKEKAARG